jgi:hypothetical protein
MKDKYFISFKGHTTELLILLQKLIKANEPKNSLMKYPEL